MNTKNHTLLLCALCFCALPNYAQSAQGTDGREIPARTIPVPTTVSPEMQKQIAKGYSPALLKIMESTNPKNAEEWKRFLALAGAQEAQELAAIKKLFPMKIEPGTMAGVKVYTLTPPTIAPENRNRVIVHLHGGAYVMYAGETGIIEGLIMAQRLQIKVISVDYRMPPDHPFPAAVDDAVAVWKEVIKTTKASSAAIGGTSAGGGLTLATALRLKELKLPLPGALFGGTTWADLQNTGDTMRTNALLDNVAPSMKGVLSAAGLAYAGNADLKNPLISPIYGDFSGFPPTILVSGTRDVLLSDTVRIHRKMRQTGVEAQLHVFEAMSHAEYLIVVNAPESKEAWNEVGKFFNQHLKK